HVNGLFARPGWTPLTFMCRSLPFAELIALYRAADVAMVTPLRDGMNLVAKEFVAAHCDAAGVLILSEFAGAARQLREALLVNPYDVDAMAESIERALNMPENEQRARMRQLNTRVSRFDVHHWRDSFILEARLAP